MSDCNISKKLQIKCTLDGVYSLVLGTSMSEDFITLLNCRQTHPPSSCRWSVWGADAEETLLWGNKVYCLHHGMAWGTIAKT